LIRHYFDAITAEPLPLFSLRLSFFASISAADACFRHYDIFAFFFHYFHFHFRFAIFSAFAIFFIFAFDAFFLSPLSFDSY
jgi:hypothetical protein